MDQLDTEELDSQEPRENLFAAASLSLFATAVGIWAAAQIGNNQSGENSSKSEGHKQVQPVDSLGELVVPRVNAVDK